MLKERAFSARDGDSGDSASPLTFELTEGNYLFTYINATNINYLFYYFLYTY